MAENSARREKGQGSQKGAIMSHLNSCPDSYTARREGERAADYGYGSFRNPYHDDCDEAARAWDRGYYAEQERLDEEARERRAAERRADERAQEEAYLEQQYWEDMRRAEDAEYERAMEADYEKWVRQEAWNLYTAM